MPVVGTFERPELVYSRYVTDTYSDGLSPENTFRKHAGSRSGVPRTPQCEAGGISCRHDRINHPTMPSSRSYMKKIDIEKGSKRADARFRITVEETGPNLVYGQPPLAQQFIMPDAEGESWYFQQGAHFPTDDEPTALCRCGASKHKPYCDGSHASARWDPTLTARDEPLLAEAATEWFKRNKTSKAYAASARRYFEQTKRVAHASILSVKDGRISRFDDLFRKYAAHIGWDWRLLASLAYAESNFDPTVVSWAGARGLMQLMPRTARAMGVPEGKEDDPEESVKAAVNYIGRLDKSFSSITDTEERANFILASYNAGEGHVKDAIALAAKYGADPTRWKGNVEKYLKLKSHERYFNDPVCRNGYFRGEETCSFVADIRSRYHFYKEKIKH